LCQLIQGFKTTPFQGQGTQLLLPRLDQVTPLAFWMGAGAPRARFIF
jgi:hypothetical protein